MRSVYDVSEYELLTNYDLFEKSLRQTVPNHVVDVILHCLKEELLQYTSTKNSYLAINDILVKIQQKNNKWINIRLDTLAIITIHI